MFTSPFYTQYYCCLNSECSLLVTQPSPMGTCYQCNGVIIISAVLPQRCMCHQKFIPIVSGQILCPRCSLQLVQAASILSVLPQSTLPSLSPMASSPAAVLSSAPPLPSSSLVVSNAATASSTLAQQPDDNELKRARSKRRAQHRAQTKATPHAPCAMPACRETHSSNWYTSNIPGVTNGKICSPCYQRSQRAQIAARPHSPCAMPDCGRTKSTHWYASNAPDVTNGKICRPCYQRIQRSQRAKTAATL